MKNILLIARRDLYAYLKTMSGYVIIAGILFVDGLLFNSYALRGSAKLSSEVLSGFFYFTSGSTMVCGLLLAMRLLSEERQTGTLSLLYSSPVRDVEIVLGKYLSGIAFLSLFLAITFYMPALVWMNGKVSWGHIGAGYLGLLLVGSATLAIGTLGSSLTKSQVLAAIVSAVMLVSLLVMWFVASVAQPPYSSILEGLAFYWHFKPFQDGLIQTKNIVYFVSVTYVALFAATRVLEARRWR